MNQFPMDIPILQPLNASPLFRRRTENEGNCNHKSVHYLLYKDRCVLRY